MTLRRLRRAVALAFTFGICLPRFWWKRLRGPLSLEERALWLQSVARAAIKNLDVELRMEGSPPAHGLLVANHLSYLDAALICAVTPCTYVARADMREWPLFGTMAACAGTIFLNRSSLASANAAAGQVATRLKGQIPVVVFPEGTSSDGTTVLRFHARLLHPATASGAPITAAALRYVFAEGTAEREVCFYGDHELMRHLWKVLGLPKFAACIRFSQPQVYGDPRHAAERTHAEVVEMRAERVANLVSSGS